MAFGKVHGFVYAHHQQTQALFFGLEQQQFDARFFRSRIDLFANREEFSHTAQKSLFVIEVTSFDFVAMPICSTLDGSMSD